MAPRVFFEFWSKRELLFQLARRNIEARYKGSVMGLLWTAATPLVMLFVYIFFFGVIFKAHWSFEDGGSKTTFAFILFCGMTVFNIFSESVSGSVGIIPANPNYVKRVIFPLEILPASAVLSSLFFGLVWLGILFLGTAVLWHKISFCLISLPAVLTPLFLFSCGVSWWVASLGVYWRDLAHAVTLCLQALLFMTPIFYRVEMVPEGFRRVLLFNPLATIVEAVRDIMIYGRWPDWPSLGVVTLLSLAVFCSGYVWFMKTKRGFADVL